MVDFCFLVPQTQSCSLDQSGNYPDTTGSSDYDGTNNSSSRSVIWSNEMDEMDYLMDHCIAIDSNRRMQEQYIKNLKLTFKDAKMEDEVRAKIRYVPCCQQSCQ